MRKLTRNRLKRIIREETRKLVSEDVDPSVIEGLDGPTGVVSYLEDEGIEYRRESINGNTVFVVGKKQHIVEFEGQFPVVSTLEEFIREKSSNRYFSEFTGIDWRTHYTEKFWNMVGSIGEYNELYHATDQENVESILEDGIRATNETRIPTSKIRRRAVFAVKDYSFLQDEVYGGAILSIDALGMKKDGMTPPVGREKDWEKQDRAMYLKSELNLYGPIRQIVPAGEAGTGSWRDTVVIYSGVPAKYVSVL